MKVNSVSMGPLMTWSKPICIQGLAPWQSENGRTLTRLLGAKLSGYVLFESGPRMVSAPRRLISEDQLESRWNTTCSNRGTKFGRL